MGKIYDALEKFHRERLRKGPGLTPEEDRIEEIPDIENDDFPRWEGPAGIALDDRLVTAGDPNSLATEQFKILRSRILYPQNGFIARTLMVTSAMEEEGKSLIAANLAIGISQSIKEHVLLVDCDIRMPGQQFLFGVSADSGLSDYLSRDIPLSNLLVKTAIDKLTLLPGGTPPSNPSELLSSEKMSYFIEEVKSRYEDRFIIFDATPAQITAEVSALARHVDGILLVIRRGRTNREVIQRAVSVLGRDKILGVVFNAYTAFSREYEHYKSYKYGDGPGL